MSKDSLSRQQTLSGPVCPPPLSLIGSVPLSQTTMPVTHRGSGWRSVVAGRRRRILHCKQGPDSRLFGSFISKVSASQAPTHYTACIHTHTYSYSRTHSWDHSLCLAAVVTGCLLWCLSQQTHDYLVCGSD